MITNCDGCGGSCCRNQPYPPFMWEAGGELPPEDIREILRAMILYGVRDDDEPCLWLTPEGRCARYEDRPLICREMEVGSEDCLHVRQVYQIG